MVIHIATVLFCFFTATPAQSQQLPKADTARIMTMLREAFAQMQSKPHTAISLTRQALALSTRIDWPTGIVKSYRVGGMAHLFLGDTKNGMQSLENALAKAVDAGLTQDQAIIYYSLGGLYNQTGNFQKAFENAEKALKIQIALGDSIGMADSYSSLGVILSQQKLYEKANFYYVKAIDLYRIQKDTAIEAQYLGYVATNFMDMKRYPEALTYFRQSLGLRKLANTYTNLGNYFTETGNYDSGMYYFKLAIPTYIADSCMLDLAKSYENIAAIETIRGNLSSAKQLLIRALDITRSLSSTRNIGVMEEALSGVYAQMKDYKNAYFHHLEATKYLDSVLNEETAAKMAEYTTRFEVKEVEAHNRTLQKENELQRLKLQRDNIFMYGAAGIAVLLLISGMLYFRQNKLRAAQERSDLEQKQLRAQMNPHFIFNCLNSIQHFVVAGDVRNANRYLTGFAQLMRQTLEHSKAGTITLRKELAYLHNYLELELVRFENKFTADVVCSNDVDPDAIEIPAMVVQPFIENAIRHGLCYLDASPGRLQVRFYKKDSFLYCDVDDNGIGREQSQKLKERNHITYESHGMELTRRRLELVSRSSGKDYTITIVDKKNESGSPSGTLVTIKFPYTS